MKLIKSVVAAACCAILFTGTCPAQEKKIEMTKVKYDGLKQEILKHRGKVVLVDFWAHNCVPCRQAFPKFLKMHEEFADKGLVIITVALELFPAQEKAINSGNKFLNDNNSPFRSLLLDEPDSVWEKQLGYVSVPFYYVFDRQGKWVRYRAADYKDGVPYDELKKTVVQMLSEK